MRLNKITFATLTTLMLAVPSIAQAGEQPKAEDLVGKTYVGIHATRMGTDDDRIVAENDVDYVKHASGFGAEIGYRLSESSEVRLSYTDLNLSLTGWLPNKPSASNIALNYLYFPRKESFYVMGGASMIDVIESQMSANLGAGYRHYINEKMAVYFEGNGHYQFDEKYTDVSAQLGFIYFFGDTAKKVVRSKPAVEKVQAAPVVAQPMDSDKDGIIDSKDHCKNTPMSDKVDSHGCTIFTEENDELSLSVNFDNSKAIVKDEYMSDIEDAANFLNKYSHASLVIKGHTSSQGNAAFNKKLSLKRAQAIVDVLVSKFDIDASRLTAEGFGEEQLLNTANTAAAHAENRRIEAKVVATKKVAVKR